MEILRTDSSSLYSPPSRGHSRNYFFLLQDGFTPVAIASANGHSDLVDVLVKQYGCSISDAEKVKHVKYSMICYHPSVMRHLWDVLSFSCVHTSQHLFSYITTTFSYRFANLLHEF